MKYCVSSKVMQESDKSTIASGISGIELMSRAGEVIYQSYNWTNKKIYIICGKGNNGGDGYALACNLIKNSIIPTIYCFENKSKTSQYFIDKLKTSGFDNFISIDDCDYDCDVIVDCVFGVGFNRELDDYTSIIFNKINESRAVRISVDVPSGLNSDNGLGKNAIKANKTITIQAYKVGQFLADGKDKCGEIEVKDIGIKIKDEKYDIVDETIVSSCFSKRLENTNKGTYGRSVIIGGCSNYIGAVKLASYGRAALRMGCGLNTLAVPSSLIHAIQDNVVDSTLYELADKDGYLIFDKPSLDQLMTNTTAIAVGMGMGNHYDENYALIEYLLLNYNGNLLIDADGLNSLSNNTQILSKALSEIVITPHPKEMARLLKCNVQDVLENPVETAKSFALKYNVVVLLKGVSSIITNGVKTYIMKEGTSAMAKGGSGDVLSGTIVGLLARGVGPLLSAVCGSYICAKANEISVSSYGEYGTLASDTALNIGKIVREIERHNN